ncbi:unnamed protein product [Phytophthora lilii]|uniref:Unnamed protein product n=1 Tax=Phytophthora lilii TaxID=2077276 RepID=A0A9W6WZL7_9STRA|nr:unnamed protein product [Phytophthora lilii]
MFSNFLDSIRRVTSSLKGEWWERGFPTPALTTWISYVTKLNKKDPRVTVISELERIIDSLELARQIGAPMVRAALDKDTGTKKVVDRLQQLQFKLWFDEGVKTDRLSKRMAANFDMRDTKVLLDYHDFFNAHTARNAF